MSHCIYQVNLQTEFGGGEVYTRYLTEACLALGIPTKIIISSKAHFWQRLQLPESCFIRIDQATDIVKVLPHFPSLVLSHGPLPLNITETLKSHYLIAIAHMPLTGRDPGPYRPYQGIIAVSEYVLHTLTAAGLNQAMSPPLYGIADRKIAEQANTAIYKQSSYAWDKRKTRDQLLGLLEPIYLKCLPKKAFSKRPGITLGIVSRITPIKQFPILLKLIAPILKEFPNMNIEIFGAGGYASVRDCKHALQPIKNRVRFWGHQWQVGAAYAECDYVLSGLPEKEALGLNLLEAQCCNIPVIAVKAPPFTETVNDQVSGYLYTDPRLDQGADFRRVLQKINSRETPKLKPADSPHLTQFTMDSFQKTLQDIVKQIDINCHNFKGNK